jgi:D-amino-acid oxidase
LILGGGVSGLTVALTLAQRGVQVTVLSEAYAPQNTSSVAGALWEYPPSVCGASRDTAQGRRDKRWSLYSYERFLDLARNPATGVALRPAFFLSRYRISDSLRDFRKTKEMSSAVRGFDTGRHLLDEISVDGTDFLDCYRYDAPTIDMVDYLTWLSDELRRIGGTIVSARVTKPLADLCQSLLADYKADFIVNCLGLGAGIVAGDPTLKPIRGALICIPNNGQEFDRIEVAICISHNDCTDDQDMVYILPTGHSQLLLGGLVEPDVWALDLTLDSDEIRTMLERCARVLRPLARVALSSNSSVRMGLRPHRNAGVRVERDAHLPVIHNYGHGGAGVSLSWGCAAEVADLALAK